MDTYTQIGDGANTLLWKDKWLSGRSIQDLAPNLFALVSKRRVNRRLVMTPFGMRIGLMIYRV
jgi:hypothetical protein